MTALPEEKILRINCPGFGVSSTLWLGEAKPLAMYEVIVVNPISMLHLFEKKSDQLVLRQIEELQSDGMTSFRSEDDSMLGEIIADLDIRAQELHQFLKKGGLLIYFLTPPFVIQGPTSNMDNYSWLGEWVPDKTSTSGNRNMSATIRGKSIEPAADAEKSPWFSYLKQPGAEWTTIIRTENVTDGYISLASAGANKCIAGFKSSGPKAGQVVFLPAPYNQTFDSKLKECIDRWYALHTDEVPASAGLQDLSEGLSSLLADPKETSLSLDSHMMQNAVQAQALDSSADNVLTEAKEPTAAILSVWPVSAPHSVIDESVETVSHPPAQAAASAPPAIATMSPPPLPLPVLNPQAEPASSASEPASAEPAMVISPDQGTLKTQAHTAAQYAPQVTENYGVGNSPLANDAAGNDAGLLIRKMSQEISKPNAPDWCTKFSFPELEGLRSELSEVEKEICAAQARAQQLQLRIDNMDDMKNSLLSADGEHLVHACSRVFERLGWQVKQAAGNPDELWLIEDEKTQAIVRIVFCTGQPSRSELASLAESVITYWGAHEVEPKGVLLTSTWAHKNPSERPDEDYPEAMHEFAKRKNLCLLTTSQLLAIYRDLEISNPNSKSIKENLLTTNGRLLDYVFIRGASAANSR